MNDHTHAGDAANPEVQKAVTSLKERAANTQDSTGQAVAAAVANLSQAGQGALPDIRTVILVACNFDAYPEGLDHWLGP